ncbi:branched-chain amino acid transport system permease protein [Herbaspirillum sp. Sphag1AN]|uniref:branched-chain amino acid ABC transporter permease n=1 Tax=unclassified Herbaspirillum TaxID=2624150 RepID=UPI00178F23AD|nr:MULTISPECIES: branched-chain amino acid ABC transporter permease [unclassified Herbaspirillum]MBB3214020.1 branched-chain amino acid transport system permease protein [Herbaspirillum sp. Sphag1AN]MBB3247587.1 branched-chain amino acid transport system permease protein [Herbaspirillum sp. Sphag64]
MMQLLNVLKKAGKTFWLGLLLIYLVVPLALGNNNYVMSLVVAALIIGGIALSWALLGNLGGMISFGHAAFFGVGAYTSAVLSMQLHVPVMLAMLLGGVGALVAAVFMLPVLRLKGPYFALAILAYAQIFRILATECTSITGGAAGLSSIPGLPSLWGLDLSSKTGAYLVLLTIVLLFVLCYQALRDSDYGLALRAMHESEDATRVVGVNSGMLKALMLLLSAFMCGVVGAFNAHYINFLEPDYAFSSLWVALPIVAAIFGGYRSTIGPIIGAVVVYLIDQLIFKNILPSGHQLVLGGLLVAMIVFSPAGLLPLLRKLTRKNHAAT